MFRKLILVASLLLMFVFTSLTSAQGSAQIRFAHFVADAPNVDVFLNGVWMLEGYQPEWLSSFMDVQSGRLDVEIAPSGEEGGNPLITTKGLRLQGGHKYSLALMGTADNYSTLLIDETAEIADCDMSKSNFRIIVNNIAGSPPVSFYEGDQWREQNIESGSYGAVCFPAFVADTGWAVAGTDLNDVLFNFDNEEDGYGSLWEPYSIYFEGMMGSYPGVEDEDYYFSENSSYTVAPDPIAFLKAYSGVGMTYDSEVYLEFDQFIQALEDTGLDDMLREDGSYTLFVPTDQAFEALPKRDQTLLSDRDTLNDILLNHIIEGDPNYDDMTSDGSVQTLLGQTLDVSIDEDDEDQYWFWLDDSRIENYRYTMENGWRVYFISNYSLLIPEIDRKAGG